MKEYKVIIDASKKQWLPNLKEVFQYKDLLYTLAYRDFKVRYAQTFLGFLWSFARPLATLGVLFIIFGKAVKVDTQGVSYPLFAICGMSAWTYFSFVMTQAGGSLIFSQNMLKKIYFPRLVIPLSKALLGLIDFAVVLILIAGLLIYFGYMPSTNIAFLPLFILLALISALGIGIWISALSIRYRDFQQITPFIVQFGFFITPVAYPSEALSSSLSATGMLLYYLNPAAGIVEGFRWSILGVGHLTDAVWISIGVSLLLFITSLFYFRKMEETMADII